MEQTYRYKFEKLPKTDRQGPSFSFRRLYQSGDQHLKSASQSLPSLEGIVTETCQKDTETNLGDQSSDSSKHCVSMEAQTTEEEASMKETKPDEPVRQKMPCKRHTSPENQPPYTNIAMCIMAIELSEEKALAIGEIRIMLKCMFPFFRGPIPDWQKRVPYCLSRAKYFFSVVQTSGKRVWKVNHNLLKPEMFKRKNDAPSATLYKKYLHDQLGVAPVCVLKTSVKPSIKGLDRIILPSQRHFQAPATITTDTCESDDFLHARKESDGDGDDASGRTSTSANSVASDCDSMLNKKPDSISEPPAKEPKFDFTDVSHRNASHYLENNTYNFGQYQIARNPYPQMSGYQLPCYQMPRLNPLTSACAVPLYRQLNLADPSWISQGSQYSYDNATWGFNSSPGLQVYTDLWYYQQI